MSTWSNLKKDFDYSSLTSDGILVVTATNNKYTQGAVGMIKSFLCKSKLSADFIVLGKDLTPNSLYALKDLPNTRVISLEDHHSLDHWCTWILEIFWLRETSDYEYVFYVDTDILVRKSLTSLLDTFDKYGDDHDVCVIDHKRSWHKEWFLKSRDHNFNAGFIVFKGSFFKSKECIKLKDTICANSPNNDEKFLRSFFEGRELLYAPTKFNGRIIWLNKNAVKIDDIYVVHFVGQENKPWLKNETIWEAEWHKIFNMNV